MQKTIYLVRHAKSSWEHPGLADIDRPLNNRGKKNAPEMGSRLKNQQIFPDLLISSPAKRAYNTALEAIAEIAFQINEDLENIGARRLHTVMSAVLNEFLFDVPDVIGPNAKISITKVMVEEKLSELIKNKDLSQFIL